MIFWGAVLILSESVVASIHERRERCPDVISSGPMVDNSGKDRFRAVDANLGSYKNGGSEVVGDSNDMAAQRTSTASMGEEGDAEGVVVNKSTTSR